MRNEENIRIPPQVRDLAGFRSWAISTRFPERGRIDFLAGDLEVDMSPEELHTHGTVKTEIATALHQMVANAGLGVIYISRARISSPRADFSVEPDVVVVFWETLDGDRLRYIPETNPDAEGWQASPRLGHRFRLVRREMRPGRWIYRLEHDGEG